MATNRIPTFRHLKDEEKRARLIDIRRLVAPILSNNLFPYYTVHDVEHSDRVAGLIDELLISTQAGDDALSAHELFILYASAYMHDIGMQFENVAHTRVIQQVLPNEEWGAIAQPRRLELLRRYHPAVSAELVVASTVGHVGSIPGLQFREDEDPIAIACLCEAHGEDTQSSRYAQLMEDSPGVRMRLLAGLLRVADILEESRRRAPRSRAESLLLPEESQLHWWRLYYTTDVTVDQNEKAITIWFEFPPSLARELERIVPELQVPAIREEFARHLDAFAKIHFSWAIRDHVRVSQYHVSEEAPPRVIAEMLAELQRRRQRALEYQAQALETIGRDAELFVQRQLGEVGQLESEGGNDDKIVDALTRLAHQVRQMGAPESAVPLLQRAVSRSASLSKQRQLEIGTALAKLLLDVGRLDEAQAVTAKMVALADPSDTSPEVRAAFASARIQSEHEGGFFEDAVASIDARLIDSSDDERAILLARRAEVELLSGASIVGEPEDG